MAATARDSAQRDARVQDGRPFDRGRDEQARTCRLTKREATTCSHLFAVTVNDSEKADLRHARPPGAEQTCVVSTSAHPTGCSRASSPRRGRSVAPASTSRCPLQQDRWMTDDARHRDRRNEPTAVS